jgi:hypothetical protein
MAPALDTAAAVIILALALAREWWPEPKSSKRTTVWPAMATNRATDTGTQARWPFL